MALVSYGFLLMCNERFNSELKRLAAMDPLTGLYNRRALEEFAQMEIARVRRGGEPFLFMLIDMDLFKRINDSFGHAVGDIALKQVASTLRSNLRTQDVIGRLGGDEFAVLLPSTDRETGETIASRLSSIILATPFCHNGQSVEMRVSIGIGEFCRTDGELDFIMSQADAELYQEKKRKKLTVV
jgi:diguanylate cyclase (GGDEF)-like protein